MRHIQLSKGITVVIPVYNRADLVRETLSSLELQKRIPEEVILIDNGSVDTTPAVLQNWADEMNSRGWKVTVLTEPVAGASHARQKGLEHVKTEYVIFFDSDDWMPAGHIEYIMRRVEAQPADILCWNLNFHKSGNKKAKTRRITPANPIRNHFIQGLLSTQAFVVKTKFLVDAGGWKGDLKGWIDYELGVRLLLKNPILRIDTEARVDVRVHGESITGTGFSHRSGAWEEALDLIEGEVNASQHPRRQEMLRYVAYRRINLAAHYHREGRDDLAKPLLARGLKSSVLRRRDRLWLKSAYLYTSAGLPWGGAIFPLFLG